MTYRIIQGDCIEGMKTIADESVHCVVTSPPYYGLRDYGTASWEGGDPQCDHVQIKNTSTASTLNSAKNGIATQKTLDMTTLHYKNICGKCGAVRVDQQIGLEETPEAYVAKMVDVFREVRRILRSDGTVWLNLGDSYAGNNSQASNNGRAGYGNPRERIVNRISDGLKPKDLIGIPWRVAFALQADGWWLRQDIIWHKPNPMPESVTDRCTKSHEYIFLLTKSERYYYDADAVKEKAISGTDMGLLRIKRFAQPDRVMHHALSIKQRQEQGIDSRTAGDGTRNKRSVWTVSPQPYAEAHFAVYPPKLIEPCILAGCPVGGTVFDPFTGSGTTAYVALSHNRHYVGTELNPEYVALAEKRLSAIQPRMELL